MHMLSALPGGYIDESGATITVVEQDPADIVILSAADTTLALLAAAHPQAQIGNAALAYPSVRLTNLLHLRQNASIDLYLDQVLQHARVVAIDHLGGESYWPYGTEQAGALCRLIGARFFDLPLPARPPRPLPPVAVFHPQQADASAASWRAQWIEGAPCVLVLFYRAHLQAGNTQVFA